MNSALIDQKCSMYCMPLLISINSGLRVLKALTRGIIDPHAHTHLVYLISYHCNLYYLIWMIRISRLALSRLHCISDLNFNSGSHFVAISLLRESHHTKRKHLQISFVWDMLNLEKCCQCVYIFHVNNSHDK